MLFLITPLCFFLSSHLILSIKVIAAENKLCLWSSSRAALNPTQSVVQKVCCVCRYTDHQPLEGRGKVTFTFERFACFEVAFSSTCSSNITYASHGTTENSNTGKKKEQFKINSSQHLTTLNWNLLTLENCYVYIQISID